MYFGAARRAGIMSDRVRTLTIVCAGTTPVIPKRHDTEFHGSYYIARASRPEPKPQERRDTTRPDAAAMSWRS